MDEIDADTLISGLGLPTRCVNALHDGLGARAIGELAEALGGDKVSYRRILHGLPNMGNLYTRLILDALDSYENSRPRQTKGHCAAEAPSKSLRDYFAGQALTGILAGGFADAIPHDDVNGGGDAAFFAYQYADAMLKAREAVYG